MSAFKSALGRYSNANTAGRRWLYVPYDQLTDEFGPLSREPARELGIVLVENPEKAARRPYHRQKLAFVLASMRHFALEQAARGVAVRHIVAKPGLGYTGTLDAVVAELGPLRMMRAAERELRSEIAPLVEQRKIDVVPHEGWLSNSEDFASSASRGGVHRMDAFYRRVRKRTGILMTSEGKFEGGRLSFDSENRQAWRGTPRAPALPTYEIDPITAEVVTLVEQRFARHPGVLRPELIAASKASVEHAWEWAKRECLASFGPFEDAMSAHERTLFHTRISPLINLSRLSARRVVGDVLAMQLPLGSKEGFVRQIIGWREYMHHVHEATDGFRLLAGTEQPCAGTPGDGGFRTWSGKPWLSSSNAGGDGGSLASHLDAHEPVPPAYWGAASGLRCLDEVVKAVWEEGYSHHITRLMILANVGMLLDLSPRELTDWFWVAYEDAYDWVVEPNVHAMGTFGVGDRFTTKPYVAGAAYIDRMSDYCGGCRFDPKKNCPLTPMYWAFLARHRPALSANERMRLPLLSEAKRSPQQRQAAQAVFERVRAALRLGAEISPSDV